MSSDKHVADTVLPFNKETQSQASDYLKYGATLKIGYDKTLLSVGELWLDLPVTAVDASRQLLTSYWGTNLKSQLSDQLYAEIGRVEKVSPRNEEDFKKFSFTANGMTKESDGLNYIDLRYQFTPSLKGEYYFGNLEDLYNKHYVGLEHTWKQPTFALTSKFKYFNAKDDGNTFDIDAQNIGLLETVKIKTIPLVWVTNKLLVSRLTRYQMASYQKLISLTGMPQAFSKKMKSPTMSCMAMTLKITFRA